MVFRVLEQILCFHCDQDRNSNRPVFSAFPLHLHLEVAFLAVEQISNHHYIFDYGLLEINFRI